VSAGSSSSNIGLYWGDDAYGIGRAVEALATRVAETAGGPLEHWRATGEVVSPEVIAEHVAMATLFGGGSLAVVSEPWPLVRSKAAREALKDILSNVAPGNALALTVTLDGSGRPPAALEALREAVRGAGGEALEFKTPKGGAMTRWIEDRAKERSIRLEPGSARELATRIGALVAEGDIDRRRQGMIAVGELEKLALYRPDGPVSVEDVRALVAETVPGSAWALLDAVGERRTREAAELLERLIATTPEPVLLAQLHRRIRQLIEVADHLAAGTSAGALVRIMRMKPFQADKLAGQARRWTVPELVAALDGLLELDGLVKGVAGATATDAQRRLGFSLWLVELVSASPTVGPGSTVRAR
jgi:DNA polymerase III delta subunit